MRPAEEIAVTVRTGGGTPPIVICLRASLRAASRLERNYGLRQLCTKLGECHFGATVDTIVEGASLSRHEVLAIFSTVPIGSAVAELCEPLFEFVLALAGIDPEAKPDARKTRGMSYTEYHERLFSIATGWLGWPPADAWAATPSEIIEAYKGRQEMFAAIFGTSDTAEDTAEPTPEQVRANLATLRAISGGRA